MRDLFFIGFMLFLFALAFVRPYLATLCYLWIDLLQPQQQAYYLINGAPVSLIAALAAVLAYTVADQEKRVRFTGIQILLLLMIGWITVTTSRAEMGAAAWFKWDAAWKALGFAIFLPMVFRTRHQIETAMLVILFTVAALMFSGAFKTLLGGGGYGHLSFLVNRNVGLFEASTMATVAVGMIPITLHLYRHGTLFPKSRWTLLIATGLVLSAVLVVIGSEARTGFMCIAAVAMLEYRHVQRKFVTAIMAVIVLACAIPFLPSTFTGRVNTIKTYDEDTSASTRVAMWGWTWDYVKSHPFGGGFEVWRKSQIAYTIKKVDKSGKVGSAKIEDAGRGFHSSFFEVLGEQGFLGLGLFVAIMFGTIVQLTFLGFRFRKDPDMAWAVSCSRAFTSFIVVYLIGSTFQALAFQSTVYHILALSVALINICAWHVAAQKPTAARQVPVPQRRSFRPA